MITDGDTLEEFSAGNQYDEILLKCYLCGRMITHEPVVNEVHGNSRDFCSKACIQDYNRYRKPYVDDPAG